MQGRAFRAFATITLYSVAFSNAFTFASLPKNYASSDTDQALYTTAGCMGCHQGETIDSTSRQFPNDQAPQKKHLPPSRQQPVVQHD